MGNFFRVTVTEEDGTSVLELAAPVEMLRQFAPQAVAAALGTELVTDQQLDSARERLQSWRDRRADD